MKSIEEKMTVIQLSMLLQDTETVTEATDLHGYEQKPYAMKQSFTERDS